MSSFHPQPSKGKNSIDFITLVFQKYLFDVTTMDHGYVDHSFEPNAFDQFVVFPLCLCTVSIDSKRNANGLMILSNLFWYIQNLRELIWMHLFATWWKLLPVRNLSQEKQTESTAWTELRKWNGFECMPEEMITWRIVEYVRIFEFQANLQINTLIWVQIRKWCLFKMFIWIVLHCQRHTWMWASIDCYYIVDGWLWPQ